MLSTRQIAVIGAGSWGTAISIHLARLGHHVYLWGRDAAQMSAMEKTRENTRYLSGIAFPHTLQVSNDLSAVLSKAEIIVIAMPSHAFRAMLMQLSSHISTKKPPLFVWITKGLDPTSHQLLHQVAEQCMGKTFPFAVLSGPTFAREIALGLPAAVTLACHDETASKILLNAFHSPQFRVYLSKDMAGVELGGAVKNVLAIAVGIAEGLQCGANAQAALITRGMAEMLRLSKALGAQPETLMGLSGLGDLILTCTNNQSRNRRFGTALGQGQSAESAQRDIGQVVEGITTAAEIYHLSQQYHVDMPIVAQVYHVLYQQLAPAQALSNLLSREPKAE